MKYSKRHFLLILLVWLLSMVSISCQQEDNNQEFEPESQIDINQENDSMTAIQIPDIEATTIQVPDTEATSIPKPALEIMYIKLKQYGSLLNVRDNKSTDSYILGKLDHSEKVEVIQVENEWAKIHYMDGIGYVYNEYLTKEQPPQIAKPQITEMQITEPQIVTPAQLSNSSDVFLEVFKEDRILKLWKEELLLGEYPIGLGFNPLGHKEKEGDGKTPEGRYYVCVKNSNSRFYLSLGVSYPGISDAENAIASDRITQSQYESIVSAINLGTSPPWNTPLGGEIMIHGNGSGSDWTAGCVAVENDVMNILWEKCEVGTRIDIYP